MLPSWIVNVAEAPRLGGPSPRARLYQQVGVSPRGANQGYTGYTGAGRVGVDTGASVRSVGACRWQPPAGAGDDGTDREPRTRLLEGGQGDCTGGGGDAADPQEAAGAAAEARAID